MNSHEPQVELDIGELAFTLLRRTALLSRLVFARSHSELHRNDASLLARLEPGPQRISTLCELEALAQPTVTLLVKRLEEAGLVTRTPDPTDGRAVLVSLTDAGRATLASARTTYTALLRRHLEACDSEQLTALTAGSAVIADLIEAIERDAATPRGAHQFRDQPK